MTMLAFIGNLGWQEVLFMVFLWPLVAWSLVWKLIGMWKAARRNHQAWFLILCFAPTAGILDIIYIFAVAKGRDTGAPLVTEGTAQQAGSS